VILRMDQRKIRDGGECLRVSMRGGERAMPVAWKGKKVKGHLGFEEQKWLLDAVGAMLPIGRSILLAADRFSGPSALIRGGQTPGWPSRLRLQDKRILRPPGGEIPTGEAAQANRTAVLQAACNESGVTTPMGMLPEQGHQEAWMIARSEPPSQGRILADGRRGGSEGLFSDFPASGLGLTQTQRQPADRSERLILVLTIARSWAVSPGRQPTPQRATPKKRPEA
jgi:hypothetical protein